MAIGTENECLLNYKEALRINNKELTNQFENECQYLFREEEKEEKKMRK